MLWDFDIWNGWTTYERVPDGLEIWGFGTPRNNSDIINFYINESSVIKNFILYLKDQQRDIIFPVKNNIFAPSNFQILSKLDESSNPEELFLSNKIKRFYFTDKDYLTRRELQCLVGIVNQKSAKQMANELGLSPRTVEKNLENLRSRIKYDSNLQVTNILKSSSLNHLFFSDLMKLIE
jgi:DNA-binding CsgD family transcriptional regulator